MIKRKVERCDKVRIRKLMWRARIKLEVIALNERISHEIQLAMNFKITKENITK